MSEIKTRMFVDEDWKARVQREKEEARLKAEGGGASKPAPKPASKPDAAAPQAPPESAAATDTAAVENLQEANPLFEGLVNMLATQAMYCLGLLGPQGQGPVTVNLEQAKESIELVMMLREKTQGNCVPAETMMLQETIAELQRLFAARVQQAQAQAMQQAGINPNNLRETPPR